MQGYIEKLILCFGHKLPAKPLISSHNHCKINYEYKVKLSPEEAAIPSLYDNWIKCVQDIVGEVLIYGRAVNEKYLVSLNAIVTQQDSSTDSTNEDIYQLTDYLAT